MFLTIVKINIKKKNLIEQRKEENYFIVGLFRVFGALTFKELNYIFKELECQTNPMELFHSSYASRFIDLNYYTYEKEYSLKELSDIKCELVDTHPKKIRLKYNYEQFVEIGINYYLKTSPEYKKLKR